jgi:hypothetical protein
LPPSSSDTGVTVSAARFITRLHLRRAGEHDHVDGVDQRVADRSARPVHDLQDILWQA